jgi:hypothetical protein
MPFQKPFSSLRKAFCFAIFEGTRTARWLHPIIEYWIIVNFDRGKAVIASFDTRNDTFTYKSQRLKSLALMK